MANVTDCCQSIPDRQKVSSGHHNSQYLDVTATFTNFNSFATSSKTIFLVFFNKQFKQTKSARFHSQLGIPRWSIIIYYCRNLRLRNHCFIVIDFIE